MIKRILVPLDPSPYAEAALEFAGVLARQHAAELGGLVILDVPGIERSVGAIPMGGLYYAGKRIADEEKKAEARIQKLLTRFRTKCEELGVPHFESERQGGPSENILRESNFYDCLVIGVRTYFTYSTDAGEDLVYGTADDHSGDVLSALMKDSVIPLFAVPKGWRALERAMRICIAFDGSRPAVRALHHVAQLVIPAGSEITLVNSSDNVSQGRFLLDQAAHYLAVHGFTNVAKEWTPISIRQAMADTYAEAADLLVLGAHSHSGVLDFMVGNLCKDLIGRGTKALLIGR
jgi:nucleotide-binding universal stress UspA family protein